jgi:hypothetical protein
MDMKTSIVVGESSGMIVVRVLGEVDDVIRVEQYFVEFL